MGKALAEAYPNIRGLYEEASSVLGYDIAALCFHGPAGQLNLTEYTQPALLVSSIATRSNRWALPRSLWLVIAWVNTRLLSLLRE
jgi:malonyl CoA-acyl carrier protein transacylase